MFELSDQHEELRTSRIKSRITRQRTHTCRLGRDHHPTCSEMFPESEIRETFDEGKVERNTEELQQQIRPLKSTRSLNRTHAQEPKRFGGPQVFFAAEAPPQQLLGVRSFIKRNPNKPIPDGLLAAKRETLNSSRPQQHYSWASRFNVLALLLGRRFAHPGRA